MTSPEEIVRDVIANARLSGLEISPEAIAICRAIANGELTADESVAQRIARLKRDEVQ